VRRKKAFTFPDASKESKGGALETLQRRLPVGKKPGRSRSSNRVGGLQRKGLTEKRTRRITAKIKEKKRKKKKKTKKTTKPHTTQNKKKGKLKIHARRNSHSGRGKKLKRV